MSESSDLTALFRCRYCKKCIQGITNFARHKRAHHLQEFQPSLRQPDESTQPIETSFSDESSQSETPLPAVAIGDDEEPLHSNFNSDKVLQENIYDVRPSLETTRASTPERANWTENSILYDRLNRPDANSTSGSEFSQLDQEEVGDDIQVIGIFPSMTSVFNDSLRNTPRLRYQSESGISGLPAFSEAKSISEMFAQSSQGYNPQNQMQEDFSPFPKIIDVRSLAGPTPTRSSFRSSSAPHELPAPALGNARNYAPHSPQENCTVTKLEFKEFHEVITKAFPDCSPNSAISGQSPGVQTYGYSMNTIHHDKQDFHHPVSPTARNNSNGPHSHATNLPQSSNLIRPLSAAALSSLPQRPLQSSRGASPTAPIIEITADDSSTTSRDPLQGKDQRDPLLCPVCYKPLRSAETLANHMRLHTGEKPFKCSQCDLKFSQRFTRQRHEINAHGRPLYSCPQCPKKFYCLTERSKHRAQHHGREVYRCRFCRALFQGVDNLKFHESLHVEESNKPSGAVPKLSFKASSFQTSPGYKCRSCTMWLPTSDSLKEHEKANHSGKRFKCKYCNKSFSRSTTCNYHQNLHTGARPYRCESCNKTFSHPASRIQHEIHYHSHSELNIVSKINCDDNLRVGQS